MFKFKAVLAALLSLLTFVAILSPAPAQAVQPPRVVQAATSWYVAPITCENDHACVLAYVGTPAPHKGYWMARRANGTTWVRLTMVAGWDNTQVAQITCATEDSCVQDYYDCNIWVDGCYWMTKFTEGGTKWVRETLMYGS